MMKLLHEYGMYNYRRYVKYYTGLISKNVSSDQWEHSVILNIGSKFGKFLLVRTIVYIFFLSINPVRFYDLVDHRTFL